MSKTATGKFKVDDTRHCKEDALSDREFERMFESTFKMDDDYFALECRFVLMVAGRLGLRSGEIVHMDESWIDWKEKMITIPRYEQCNRGRDGGICGACMQSAKQMVEYNEGLDLETAKEMMWSPKTENAAREVPFDATVRTEMAIEDYFDRFDEFKASGTAVNRRVERMAMKSKSVDPDNIYPHALRSTAASYWAGKGLNVVALKSLFGWSQFSVALNYIEESGERTSKAVKSLTG